MTYRIADAGPVHAIEIVKRLSDISREDVELVGKDPVETLLKSIASALIAHVGLVDDEPVCMWGLEIISLATGKAYLWMVTTPELEEHKFRFIRISQEFMKKLLCEAGFTEIRAVVLNKHEKSLRWLRFLKFEAVGAEKVGSEYVTSMVVRREAWQPFQH